MYKIISLFVVFSLTLLASSISPSAQYKASGAVIDLIIGTHKLYAATSAGKVDIFDIKTKKHLREIQLPNIKDFTGEDVTPKVFSVDKLSKDILILTQGEHGYSRIYIEKDGKLTTILSDDDSMAIAKAKFINKNTLLLAMLSNEIISFDIQTKKTNWLTQASGAKFSNFVLNENKTEVVIADESGELKIIDIKNGKITKLLKGQNLDNVFQVDYKNGIIATAGQDRRAVIYAVKFGSAYYKKSHFLIYSVGLSPSGKLAGYASDENNNVTVFDTITQKDLGTFTGNRMTLTNIVFYGENQFFSASDDRTINLYKIK